MVESKINRIYAGAWKPDTEGYRGGSPYMDISLFIELKEREIESANINTYHDQKAGAVLSALKEFLDDPEPAKLDPPRPAVLENPNPRKAPRYIIRQSRYPKKR